MSHASHASITVLVAKQIISEAG